MTPRRHAPPADGACAVQLCAGLLHDTVEDTALEFGDLDVLFGPTVRKIVEGETKVSKLPKMVRRRCCPAL